MAQSNDGCQLLSCCGCPYAPGPNLCYYICKPDTDPLQKLTRKCRYRSVNPCTDKLGYPVGVLRSLVASSDKASFSSCKEMNGQRYAMCLKAFALLHILPITDWEESILDCLMIDGAELYAQSSNKKNRAGKCDSASTVYNQAPYNRDEAVIKRNFKLQGYDFEIELGSWFVPSSQSVTCKLPQIKLNTLETALNEFFVKNKYCLLSTTNYYLLVWRSRGMFFVLDFYGRTHDKLALKRNGGYATLLNFRRLNNVYYFLSNMTPFDKKDIFTLRDMRLTMLVDPKGRTQLRDGAKRAQDFVIVSDKYAYLKSDLHLPLKEKDPLLSRCGLPVSVAVIMSAKIDYPATWETTMLNKIICYGFYVCRNFWGFCKTRPTPINLNSFPNQLQIGQFTVNLILISQMYQGIWHCVPRYEPTELSESIRGAFDQGNRYLILAINQQNYAVFKKNNFYYLFDPYCHRLPCKKVRRASLRMFNTMSEFFQVLNLILLESNITSPYCLHRAVVTNVEYSPSGKCVTAPPSKVCTDKLQEVQSINETICFREDYKRCSDELGQCCEDEEEELLEEEEWSCEEKPEDEDEGCEK